MTLDFLLIYSFEIMHVLTKSLGLSVYQFY